MLIYKILLPNEWAEFEASGRFDGSPFDHASGFIHLSSRAQVGATATRFFADEPVLVVVAVDADAVGDDLRWEPADRGMFPHLYAPLTRDAVVTVHHVDGAELVDRALPELDRALGTEPDQALGPELDRPLGPDDVR